MARRILIVLGFCLTAYLTVDACCPAPRGGKPVVNADQSVIIIWDAANQIQHFIRRASFKSEGDDFGFIVPSPNQPELSESGNDAFPYLQKLTEPEIKTAKRSAGGGCGCGWQSAPKAAMDEAAAPKVNVLDQKTVAGFDASVLETKSATALVDWLKENGYAFSPEIEAWAKPYIEQGWKFTALKVAKAKDAKESKTVAASALRITFKTDRPLFPYREPDYKNANQTLGVSSRLLRIYFLADARYEGKFSGMNATDKDLWTGRVAWAGKLSDADRKKVLEELKLPETTGPKEWWLTEFEDNWPYKVAPADVYFSRADKQEPLKREPIIRFVSAPFPTDGATYALAAVMTIPPIVLRLRRKWRWNKASL